MKQSIVDQLASKKFRAFVIALGAIMTESGSSEPWYVVVATAAVASVYIFAQGYADKGKEAAKVLLQTGQAGETAAKEALKIKARSFTE